MCKLTFDAFTKKIHIKAPIEKLYWCWGTEEGICSWFLRKAQYTDNQGKTRSISEPIQKGDAYIWEWHNWDEQEKGQVLQANGTDFLEISFAGVSKVSVSLEDKGNAVLVTLKQYDIPTDEENKLNIHYGCSNGWTFWLANLKAYVEHGILLNETEFDLRNIPLAGYEFVNM
ncbi:MAG: SRPBCC domain-containing protein [Bacteroidota bacterium]